jgi:hypothetical protein
MTFTRRDLNMRDCKRGNFNRIFKRDLSTPRQTTLLSLNHHNPPSKSPQVTVTIADRGFGDNKIAGCIQLFCCHHCYRYWYVVLCFLLGSGVFSWERCCGASLPLDLRWSFWASASMRLYPVALGGLLAEGFPLAGFFFLGERVDASLPRGSRWPSG